MSFGQHAVVVEPSRFLGQQDELAERLAPVLRVPVDQVVGMLQRGPVTVDADLDEGAARRLLKRLDSLGIPADLRDGTGNTLSSSATPASAPPSPAAPPKPTQGLSQESDAWGAVLPDLDTAPASNRSRLGEPDEVDDRSASLIAQFEETARQTDEQERMAPPTNAPSPPTALPSPQARGGDLPGGPSTTPPGPPPQPRSSGPSETRSPLLESIDEPTRSRKNPGQRNGPRQPPSRGPSKPDTHPDRTFDAGLITAALTPGDSNKPPYAPTGFDAAPPHFPGLAAGLSAVAPGAGQIYNGDDDEALDYGLKFFLILPWIKSVQNAKRRGEKVATHWLPRPEEGALFRALKYVLVWWAAAATVITITVLLVSAIWEQATREPVIEITEAEIATAMEDAQTEVRLGRIAAMQALSEAQLDVPSKRFTMSDEERAHRLFIIAYGHCESRNYRSCESLMKRVASLQQDNAAQAFRLQAWASAAQSGNAGKFPAVEGLRTLSEFEAAEISQELGVPPPPRRKPEVAPSPVGDAGTPSTSDASTGDSAAAQGDSR